MDDKKPIVETSHSEGKIINDLFEDVWGSYTERENTYATTSKIDNNISGLAIAGGKSDISDWDDVLSLYEPSKLSQIQDQSHVQSSYASPVQISSKMDTKVKPKSKSKKKINTNKQNIKNQNIKNQNINNQNINNQNMDKNKVVVEIDEIDDVNYDDEYDEYDDTYDDYY